MNKIIKYILFFLVFFINTGLYAQSVIKHVSGDVYQVIGSIQKPIKDLNTIVNDSNLLIFAPSSYIIVEIDGKKSMINAEDHENGIRLINFNNHTNNHTNKESSSFWAEIFDAVYDDSFDKKIDIDGLKIVGSQGITRSISNNLLELRVLPNYRSKIEYVEGKNLTINTNCGHWQELALDSEKFPTLEKWAFNLIRNLG